MSRWRKRPKVRIPEYSGPYRRNMLEEARQELMNIIDSKDTVVWSRIRNKTGIFPNGERDTNFPGWGQASCEFSHADLKDNLDTDQFTDSDMMTCTNSGPNFPSSSQPTSSSSGMYRASPTNSLHDKAKSPDVIHIDGNGDDNDLYSEQHGKDTQASPGVILLDSDTEEVIPVTSKGHGKSTNIIPLDSGLTDHHSVRRPSRERNVRSVSIESHESGSKITVEVIEGDRLEEGEIDNCSGTDYTQINESELGAEISSLNGVGSSNVVLGGHRPDRDSKQTGENTQFELDSSELQESYKCDYCEVISDNNEFIREHLQEKNHSSASLILLNSSGAPVYLKGPMEIEHCKEERSLMAICPAPNCNQAFSNIYVCSEHYSHNHDEAADPSYAIAPVETQKVIYCEMFSKKNKWKYNVKASMGDLSRIDSAYQCFLCLCSITFSNHASLTTHLNKCHRNEGKNVSPTDSARCVHILLVNKNKERHTLLPYQNDRKSEVICIRNRVNSLKLLKRTVSHSNTKSRKVFHKKIQGLKQLLKPSY